MSRLTNYFKSNYELRGSDWIRKVSKEDREALAHLAFAASDYGKIGGKVRSQTAKRDEKGRFKNEG